MKFKAKIGSRIVNRTVKLRSYEIDWKKPSRSKFQTRVKLFLYPYWEKFFVYEEFPVAGSRLTFDFYCLNLRLAVECQGNQHVEYNKFFHRNWRGDFLGQLKRDRKKEEFCELNNITLVEIFEKDRLDEDLIQKLNLM